MAFLKTPKYFWLMLQSKASKKVHSCKPHGHVFREKFTGRGKLEGQLGIESAIKAYEQLQKIDPAIQVGLCPCLGKNGSQDVIYWAISVTCVPARRSWNSTSTSVRSNVEIFWPRAENHRPWRLYLERRPDHGSRRRHQTFAAEIKIILGGPEVSYETEGQPIVQLADHVITGEADLKFAEVCRALAGSLRLCLSADTRMKRELNFPKSFPPSSGLFQNHSALRPLHRRRPRAPHHLRRGIARLSVYLRVSACRRLIFRCDKFPCPLFSTKCNGCLTGA